MFTNAIRILERAAEEIDVGDPEKTLTLLQLGTSDAIKENGNLKAQNAEFVAALVDLLCMPDLNEDCMDEQTIAAIERARVAIANAIAN